jgi:hypothetical protein
VRADEGSHVTGCKLDTCHGGNMRIKLALIIPAIIAIAASASIAAGAATSVASAHVSSAHVTAAGPDFLYEG